MAPAPGARGFPPFVGVPFTLAGGAGLDAVVVVVAAAVADGAVDPVLVELGVDCTLAAAGAALLADAPLEPPRCFVPATIAAVAIAAVARPTTSGSTQRRGAGTTGGSSSIAVRLDAAGAGGGGFTGCASLIVGAVGDGPFDVLGPTTPAERCVAFAGGG